MEDAILAKFEVEAGKRLHDINHTVDVIMECTHAAYQRELRAELVAQAQGVYGLEKSGAIPVAGVRVCVCVCMSVCVCVCAFACSVRMYVCVITIGVRVMGYLFCRGGP